MSTTVRVSERIREALRQMAAQRGVSMREILEEAVEARRRQQFFEQLTAGYEALRTDPEAWQEELEERSEWDVTLADGLENE